VKPGGRIVYITCSVLPEEGDEAVAGVLARRAGLRVVPARDVLERAGLASLSSALRFTEHGLQMTPAKTGTDGFYVATLAAP
jgi:16S rRNA (cytosine967-C5)-methyltransferase